MTTGASTFADTPIRASEIKALQAEITELKGSRKSVTSRRRALKNIVRGAERLIDRKPEAPNRFDVLAIILDSHKLMLGIENTEETRQDLFEVCEAISAAPDEYAFHRLEADMLLMERQMTATNADLEQRAEGLSEIIRSYRGTPAEAKSLMMTALIAPKLEAFGLQKEIIALMDERFPHDHEVIEFRRKNMGFTSMDALLKASFTRTDGKVFHFPYDRTGYPCLLVFWSQTAPGSRALLEQVKEQQTLYPDRFDIYSFNLDDLPDAGQSILKEVGLQCHAMRLPGGRDSQVYRSFARMDPVAIPVNEFGYLTLRPASARYKLHGWPNKPKDGSADGYKYPAPHPTAHRFLAQVQSIVIGDFLVPLTLGDVEWLKPVNDCFPAAPFRYRISVEEALGNYRKAESLCRGLLKEKSGDPDIWKVRNAMIVALLGQWKMSGDPGFLDKAADVAREALTSSSSVEAATIPRYCLTRQAMRLDPENGKAMLDEFISSLGANEAPPIALAAATILALELHDPELYRHYVQRFTSAPHEDPALWELFSVVTSRYHAYQLFKGKAYFSQTAGRTVSKGSERGYIINHGFERMNSRLPDITLKTLDGGTLTLPDANKGKITLLMFVEPPATPGEPFPREINGVPAEGKRRESPGLMQYAFQVAEKHIYNEVEVVAVFLTDDKDRIQELLQQRPWPCTIAMAPGGLANPMVRKLGVLSADVLPNIYLLRRNGTVAWRAPGLMYNHGMNRTFPHFLAMRVQIELLDVARAYDALAAGDFEQAKHIFSGPFEPWRDERYNWSGPRFHGRALAHYGLKDWEAGLADIEHAIAEHGKQRFNHAPDKPCASMTEMQRVRTALLEKLGRKEDAAAAGVLAKTSPTGYGLTIYEDFHGKLKELNIIQAQ